MKGDPPDPIPFERAITELWDRLAANAGLNLKEHQRSSIDDQSSELNADYLEREDALQALLSNARDDLLGWIIVGELRVWTEDGENWKRPTDHTLRARIFDRAADERWGLFVDRLELEAVVSARHPSGFSAPGRSAMPAAVEKSTKPPKPGRPAGTGGYAEDDKPLLVEMRLSLEGGAARSRHRAAQMIVHKAAGNGDEKSKIKRLVDRFGPWP